MLALLTLNLTMRLVLQRVTSASVTVGDRVVASINGGLVALCGLHVDDSDADLQYCAKSCSAPNCGPTRTPSCGAIR